MSKSQSRSYKSFRREFKALHDSGCRLFYPENREIRPADLAETIAKDPDATYMRDEVYDRKGRMIKVHFTRIEIV
ncbi:MAG: hypothetical protein J6E44_03910 [Lachnospiraceae bacterium]|nr:hypothetical protein [Lachnospiraceae bacterium]